MVYYISIGIPLGIILIITIVGIIYKPFSIYKNKFEETNKLEGKLVEFVYSDNYLENADGVKGYLKDIGEIKIHKYKYDFLKRLFDIILSFISLVLLLPLLLIISCAVFINNPGPIIFSQKRVGKNKRYFKLHKFRSMKTSTPHDIPTHMLENPNQYITKVGKFIRKHSLDELPQLWDIFIGNMSFIGPRPALWNQYLLISERDKFNANNVKPGLTGWAQIKGRDTLKIPVKAKLDGDYVKNYGFKMDSKVFFGSFRIFVKDDNNVEGKKNA